MKRSMRQLAWHGILLGVLLTIGHVTVGWAGNVSTIIEDTGTNVGIGTTSPDPNRVMTFLKDGNNSLKFESPIADDWSIGTGVGVPNGTFTIYQDSAFANRLTIGPSGNVGIGTTIPTTKLHVAGDVQVDGNLAAKYQDVAEWVQASSPLPPGTVVIIDPQRHNQILPASQSYDTRVAGVVSARPGLLLGEAGPDKVKVAQSGRVKVRVDAAYGPIAAGDLLVTSATPGYAMRSSPVKLGETLIHRPGTLLGKALEPLEEGQGEILVLLTLQ